MGVKEYAYYALLSKAGKAQYGKDRAAEVAASPTKQFDVTLQKLYNGFYK
jgi:hypothetical protein